MENSEEPGETRVCVPAAAPPRPAASAATRAEEGLPEMLPAR